MSSPLAKIEGLSNDVLRLLRDKWITTAEELLALAHTNPEGAAVACGLDAQQLQQLLEAVRQAIGPQVAHSIERQVEESKNRTYPTGVVPEPNRKDPTGGEKP